MRVMVEGGGELPQGLDLDLDQDRERAKFAGEVCVGISSAGGRVTVQVPGEKATWLAPANEKKTR